ncbi:MAG: hypothetical protein ACLS8R_08905 [Anaeromassilibacillus sp.]
MYQQVPRCGGTPRPAGLVFTNGGAHIEKGNNFAVFITIVFALAAVAAAAVAVVLFFEKKRKAEEELEHYLDCSIQ